MKKRAKEIERENERYLKKEEIMEQEIVDEK